MVTRKNPPIQKLIAKSLNTTVATINKIINQDLQIKKAKKHIAHKLFSRHGAQRRIFYRTLCGDKFNS